MKQNELPVKKRLRIIEVDDFTRTVFGVNVGEIYDIEHEAPGEKRYGYLINVVIKRKKWSIVMYANQVELL